MFTPKQFDKLHKLWDGKFTDSTACNTCGMCCANVEKTLFPGEYEYMVEKTGQKNLSWCSKGCLCRETGNKVKPIICKIYPMQLYVTPSNIEFLDVSTYYSFNCKKLVINYNDVKMKKFIRYLLSDIHNRLFMMIRFSLDEAESRLSAELDKSNVGKIPKEDFKVGALHKLFELPCYTK